MLLLLFAVAPASALVLFGTAPVTGNFGPRNNATALCLASAPISCVALEALVSYTGVRSATFAC